MLHHRSWYFRIGAFIERLPTWAQPAFIGAAILGAIVSIRLVFAIPAIVAGKLQPASQALIVLASAMAAGAAGGFAYSLLSRPLLKVPLIGRYLTGIVCVAAYLTPLLLWGDKVFGGDRRLDLTGTSDIVIWTFCVLLFGIVMGHTWF